MFKVGLTGSTGMIGQHMLKLLNLHQIECTCVNRKQWDLNDWRTYDELDQLFDGVEAIFHFGATLPKQLDGNSVIYQQTQMMFDANVRSSLNLAEWATLRGIPIVFISSALVYKDSHALKIRENAPQVTNGFGGFYGYTKFLAENIFEHFIEDGLQLIILRPSSVYGTGLAKDKLIPRYIALASKGEIIKIDSPHNRVNLIHAIDVSKAAIAVLKKKAWGIYNIAGNLAPSILEIAELTIRICGGGGIILKDDLPHHEPFHRFDLDSSNAIKTFSFAQTVDLEKGLTLMHQKKKV